MGTAPPAQPTGGLPEGLDAELLGFGAAATLLRCTDIPELLVLAENCPPRPVPPKALRRKRELWLTLLERWALPEGRIFLLTGVRVLTGEAAARLRDAGATALPEIEEDLGAVTAAWAALQAGLPLEAAWAALSPRARDDVAQALPALRDLRSAVLATQEARTDWAHRSTHRHVQSEVARATRVLRTRTEAVEEKAVRAQRAAEAVVRRHSAEARALRADLEAALRQIKALEAELAASREQQADLAKRYAKAVAELAERGRAPVPAGPDRPGLAGHAVLVVGDEGRRAEYRRIVEEMGGAFSFHSGFGNPSHLAAAARGATLLAFVTAAASHKSFTQARGAEQAGVPLVLIPQAGAASFREALQQWAARSDARGEGGPG